MKNPLQIILKTLIAFIVCFNISHGATVTGRSQLTTAAGTEKFPIDDGGVDKYMTTATIWKGIVLTGGFTASGSTTFDFSGSTGGFKMPTGITTFGGSSNLFTNAITPSANDGAALGSTALEWSDLFLASGGIINWNNGDILLTHSAGILTLAGSGAGDLRITTPGTNTASVVTVGGTQELTAKTITAAVIKTGFTASGSAANTFANSTGAFATSTGANTFPGSSNKFTNTITPLVDAVGDLGTGSLEWGNLFIGTGGTLNFANSDVVVTHSTGVLTVGTGYLKITTPGTASGSVVTTTGTQTLSAKTLTAPVLNTATVGTSIVPTTDGVPTLGDATHTFSDLFLKSGATLTFASTNVVLTHTSGILTVGTGDLRVTNAGTNTASVATVGGTQTLTAKTLTSPTINAYTITGTGTIGNGATITTPVFSGSITGTYTLAGTPTLTAPVINAGTIGTSLIPTVDATAPLGDSTHGFSSLFLGTGGVIKFANTDVVLTHTTGILTMGTGELRVTTPGTNAASVPTLGSTSTLTNKTLTAPTLTAVTITGTSTIASGMTITAPAIVGATITGTVTIANGSTITTPVLSGSITGTYTLAGTPTITAPTINAYTMTGTGTIGNGLTVTTPVINGATSTGGNFDLSGSSGTTKTTTGLTTLGAGGVSYNGAATQHNYNNQSTATQTPAAATRTYIAGSGLTITAGQLQVGTVLRWRFNMTKDANGNASSTIDVCFGTAGTTSDTARVSFTKPAGTAAADEGVVTIECVVKTNSSSGVVVGSFTMIHNLAATGHMVIPAACVLTTSGTFDTTLPTNIGICITSGAADVITISEVTASSTNL